MAQGPFSPYLVPFTPLPVELRRNIMEIAAEESVSTARALTLVCSYAHAWIVPILFQTISMTEASLTMGIELESRRTSELLSHVRTAFFGSRRRDPMIFIPLILRCPRLEQIYFHQGVWRLHEPEQIDVATPEVFLPRPWQLVLEWDSDIDEYIYDWLSESVFQNLTHVYINVCDNDSRTDIFDNHALLDALPSVTHFGCGTYDLYAADPLVEQTQDTLQMYPSLQVFLLVFPITLDLSEEPENWQLLVDIADERLLVADASEIGELCMLLQPDKNLWGRAKERFGGWRSRKCDDLEEDEDDGEEGEDWEDWEDWEGQDDEGDGEDNEDDDGGEDDDWINKVYREYGEDGEDKYWLNRMDKAYGPDHNGDRQYATPTDLI